MVGTFEIRRFSVRDYAKMAESGILDADDHVELIDGVVRLMSPFGMRHCGIFNRLTYLLVHLVGDMANVSVKTPIQLNDYTEPQPDVAILRWRSDFYREAKPQAADILLLIEVADSSLNYDRNEKLPRYAAAQIPEVWIVDVDEERQVVEHYSMPQGDVYAKVQFLSIGDTIHMNSLPNAVSLEVADVFGFRRLGDPTGG